MEDTQRDHIEPGVAKQLYQTLCRIRAADDLLQRELSRGRITCLLYSPGGQEAIAAGWSSALRGDDYLVCTYRCLHDAIAKGADLKPMMAEMFGRSAGFGRGRGGSMHITDPSCGLMVTTGIVGAGIPIANGLALTAKLEGSDRVTLASFGDGAVNTGSFHEAVNLAAIWELPVIFLCQNNLYAEKTLSRTTYKARSIADRATSYGIPGEQVDGFDPVAVFRAVERATNRARSGKGPTLVECLAYRWNGHFFGDPMDYVPENEITEMRKRDPLVTFRDRILDEGLVAGAELDAISQSAGVEAMEAFTWALESPTNGDDVLTDVYATPA